MTRIISVLILMSIGRIAGANPILDYVSATFHKNERWTDAGESERDVAAHPPIELRAKRASCDADIIEGKNIVMVNGEEKTALKFERRSPHQAAELLVNCGRALFRAQEADGTKDSKIPYKQFVNADSQLPSAGFLIDPPRVSIKRNPFTNLGYMVYVDDKLPVIPISYIQVAKLQAAIDDAKNGRKLLALDWSHPVDVKNHPMIEVRDSAVSQTDAAVLSPTSAN